MRSTFVTPELEARFELDGFVVLPLLDALEVEDLRAACFELSGEGTGFHADVEQADPATRQRIDERLAPVWRRHLPRVLADHRVFMSSFLVKWPGRDSALYLHNDTTYVDEERFRSVAFWVALDDADDELGNGPLQVAPGSHLLADDYRGTNVVPWYRDQEQEEAIRSTMITVPVAAGDVVVMDNRLIHASAANTTDHPRVAVAGAAIPAEADLLHAVDLGGGLVGLLRVDDRFYATNTPQALAAEPPPGPFFAVVSQTRRGPGPRTAAGADEDQMSRPPGDEGLSRVLARLLQLNHRVVARAWARQPGPVYGASVVPWLPDLEEAWPLVRSEYLVARDTGLRPIPMDLLAGQDFGGDGAWDAFVICHNGGRVEANAERFPKTAAVLDEIPGLRSGGFSVLAPGASIAPHRGANNGVLRTHLGVVVPGAPGAAVLEVGSCRMALEEGRAFSFDDSFLHTARNDAAEERVVLMVETDRPLPRGAELLNRVVQRAFSFTHPQVRGGRRRIDEVDAAVNPGAG